MTITELEEALRRMTEDLRETSRIAAEQIKETLEVIAERDALRGVQARLEIARGALADLAFSDDHDVPLSVLKAKAKRIYEETAS